MDRRPNHHASRKLTPTEQRILAVLVDGKPHSRPVLMGCLEDDLAGPGALRFHLCQLRRKLAMLRDRRIIVCHVVKTAKVQQSHFQLVDRKAYR